MQNEEIEDEYELDIESLTILYQEAKAAESDAAKRRFAIQEKLRECAGEDGCTFVTEAGVVIVGPKCDDSVYVNTRRVREHYGLEELERLGLLLKKPRRQWVRVISPENMKIQMNGGDEGA